MQVAVIGAGSCTVNESDAAFAVGKLVAENHGTVVCGGLGGVMEAACRGAREKEGATIGILPDTGDGNPFLDIVIRTGLGHVRNVIVVQSADAVIAIGGSHGTLSEIAFALKAGIPVFGLRTWDIPGVVACATPEEAVVMAVRAARRSLASRTRRAGRGSP